MNVVDFLTWVKRESGYGGAPVVTGAQAANDTPTLDLLTSLNARRKRIWRKADWDWQFEQLAFAVAPGASQVYAVTAKSGNPIDRIRNLIPNDPTATPPVSGKALTQRTERQFFRDIQGYDSNYQGLPDRYLNLGRVNGVWNVRIWPAPQSAFTMGGSAKGILNTFVIGDVTGIAPFSAGNTAQAINPPLDYFPDGVIEDILFEGVMADAYRLQKDLTEAGNRDKAFEDKLRMLAAEQANAAKDQTPITAPLPAIVRNRRERCRRRC